MRVALAHDWLTGMRGGERVLERLCAMFPDAPIFTLLWNRGAVSPGIEAHAIHTSFVQRLPSAARHYRWYLPVFPRAISSLRPRDFDAVISTSHCAAKAIPVPLGAFHLSYIHTPMRYVWELERDYFPDGKFPWPLSAYVRRTCARLRDWDVRTSTGPDALLANSAHVASRIARHYRRTAEVVPPPVDIGRFEVGRGARDFYLLAGAFAPYKRAELAIEACVRLGRRLVVAGAGQEDARLRRLAAPGIEFRGWTSDAEMARLYREARALLFPGEEDFGIVPVEALASGCPVIAYGRGGALETVARQTVLAEIRPREIAVVGGGIVFGDQSVETLCAAILRLERESFDPDTLRALAEPFAAECFDARFRDAFQRHYGAWRERRESGAEPLEARSSIG